jgi:hypothetical protein
VLSWKKDAAVLFPLASPLVAKLIPLGFAMNADFVTYVNGP